MNGWATVYIEKLKRGETVSFRPRGNSMLPRIKSRQLCTVVPPGEPVVGDVVLCTVHGRQYLHLVNGFRSGPDGKWYRISNNAGRVNGWIGIRHVHGILTRVDP